MDRPSFPLTVTLQSPGLDEPVDLQLPVDVPLGRLLERLVAALGLPPGDYRLLHGQREIPAGETLCAAGVLTGEVLVLLPAVVAGTAPVPGGEAAPAPVCLSDLLPLQVDDIGQRRGRALAFWSGPAGGTGRTVLALSTALRAAGSGAEVALLALAEPAVSAYLRLPRTPNVLTFFQHGSLAQAEQTVGWETSPPLPLNAPGAAAGVVGATLRLLLGPPRPGQGGVEEGRVAALVTAARAACPLLLLDVPSLTPGPSPWAFEPLTLVDELVLVAAPSVAGVAALVEALATARDVGTAARLHLVLVHRAPGGLPAAQFVDGVRELWGSCPPLTAQVPFLPGLGALLDRGELVTTLLQPSREQEPLASAVRALAAALGLEPPQRTERENRSAVRQFGFFDTR